MTTPQVKLRKGFSYNYRRIQHTKKLAKSVQDSSNLDSPNLIATELTNSPIKLPHSPLKRGPQSSQRITTNGNNGSSSSSESIPLRRDSPEYLDNLIRSIFINNNNLALQKTLSSSTLAQSPKNKKVAKEVPLSEHLPALTSSSKIDLSLYALIGLFIREFVMSWYNRLVIDENQDLMNELIGVSAHITRGIQQRCTSPEIDWGKVLFDDIPLILIKHIEAVKEAEARVESRFSSAIEDKNNIPNLELVNTFSQLNPHFCLNIIDYQNNPDPLLGHCSNEELNDDSSETDHINEFDLNDEGEENKEQENTMDKETQYNKVLTKTIVALLLPFEELDSTLSREFVNSIVSDLVIRNIVENLSDNFAIWGIMESLVGILNGPKSDDDDDDDDDGNKNGNDSKLDIKNFKEKFTSVGRRIGHIIAYSTSVFSKADKNGAFIDASDKNKETKNGKPMEVNIFDYAIFNLIVKTLRLSMRYPILFGLFQVFVNFVSKSGKVLHLLNNLCYNFVWNIILTEGIICSLINSLRKLFFPEDLRFTTNKRFVPESIEELEEVRLKAHSKISKYIQGNKLLMKTVYQDKQELDQDIEDLLNCFSSKYINKHLLWNIIDLLIIKLFPESTYQTPSEMINH